LTLDRPLVVSGPTLLGWLALLYAAARLEGTPPLEQGAGEAGGLTGGDMGGGGL
jgi:hypothetical protein